MKKVEVASASLKTWLSLAQQQETVLWLLSNGREWHVHHNILYSRSNPDDPQDNGVQAFLRFSHSEPYATKIVKAEKELFSKHAKEIKKIVGDSFRDIVELGPGNEKFTAWMDALGYTAEQKSKMRYIPADVSKVATDAWKEEAQALGIACGNAIHEDRTTADFSHVAHGLYLCFGGGLWNNDAAKVVGKLQSGAYFTWGYIINSYFPTPDPQAENYQDHILQLKAMYGDNSADNPYRSEEVYALAKYMVCKPFEALGFPLEKLDLDVQRVAGDPAKITLWVRVIEPFTMKIWDVTYTKEVGDTMLLTPTPRLWQATMETGLHKGGVTPVGNFQDEECCLSIAKLPTKKFAEKTKKRARNIWLILAWTAALSYWVHTYGKYSKLSDARDYALRELSYKNIEHPLKTLYQVWSTLEDWNTAYNSATETRIERLNYITNCIYDIALTEYQDYDFPDEDIVKAAIMRYIPDHTDYFTHSKWPDAYFFSFVNHVLMPHLFASFGNQEHVGLYSWMDDEVKALINSTRTRPSDFDFHISEFKNDLVAGDRNWTTKTYDVTYIGDVYMPTYSGEFKKMKLWYVTTYVEMGTGNWRWVHMSATPLNKILIAGDDELWYSVEQARKVIEFVDEKWYASLLTGKIMTMIDPAHASSDHHLLTKKLHQHILELNKQWYDLSWLCRAWKEEQVERFVGGFLLEEWSPLCNEIYNVLGESWVTLEKTENLALQLDAIMDFLHTYYGQRNFAESHDDVKDDTWVRNFLVQILLSKYFKSDLTQLSSCDLFSLLRRLDDNLSTYWYYVRTHNSSVYYHLEELYTQYSAQVVGQEKTILYGSDLFLNNLQELYIWNVIFTSDGKAWIIHHGERFPRAFELTKENSYLTMKAKMPSLLEQAAQERYKNSYALLGDYEQRMTTEYVLQELWKTVLKKSIESAYYVAQDLHKHHPELASK
jgi:hypothetical protein